MTMMRAETILHWAARVSRILANEELNAKDHRSFFTAYQYLQDLTDDELARYGFHEATGRKKLKFIGDKSPLCAHGVVPLEEHYHRIVQAPSMRQTRDQKPLPWPI